MCDYLSNRNCLGWVFRGNVLSPGTTRSAAITKRTTRNLLSPPPLYISMALKSRGWSVVTYLGVDLHYVVEEGQSLAEKQVARTGWEPRYKSGAVDTQSDGYAYA